MSQPSPDAIVIVGAARTPLGAFQGELSAFSASQLGAHAIRGAVERARVAPDSIDEVLMGCVLPAGVGQAPSRQAALGAGLPRSTACTTVSKVCGSGMKAVMLGHDLLRAGTSSVVAAGGMESMSNAPYLLPKARTGHRLGHSHVIDHMFFDGLEDRYGPDTNGRLMGTFAEDCARHFGFTREEQDDFARASTERAQRAAEDGLFDWEIAPLTVATRAGETQIHWDEGPQNVQMEKIAGLKPAFAKDGTVTAANSSSISDGAAALVMTRESVAREKGLRPIARIVAQSSYAQEPQWFTTAPVGAIRKVLELAAWKTTDVDLWEINEAFAVVTLAAMRQLSLPHERVNVHGGACAMGHPIGATGARILVTLLGALRQRELRRGVATLCIGGGEATAVAVELV